MFNMHLFVFIIIGIFSFGASAKIPIISLYDLCEMSEVMILGKTRWLEVSKDKIPVIFIEKQFKGNEVKVESLHLCEKELNADEPIYHDEQKIFLFLRRNNDCFEVVFGYKGAVVIRDGEMFTGAIEGEPDWQSEKQFIESIRACPGVTSNYSE